MKSYPNIFVWVFWDGGGRCLFLRPLCICNKPAFAYMPPSSRFTATKGQKMVVGHSTFVLSPSNHSSIHRPSQFTHVPIRVSHAFAARLLQSLAELLHAWYQWYIEPQRISAFSLVPPLMSCYVLADKSQQLFQASSFISLKIL